MPKHLTKEKVEQYRARTLDAESLLDADDHLAGCEQCRRELIPAARSETWNELADQHITYPAFKRYVDGDSNSDERETISLHTSACVECRSELDGLLEMRTLIERSIAPVPRDKPAAGYSFSGRFSFPRFAFAAGALLVVAGLTVWFLRREAPGSFVAQTVTVPAPEQIANESPGTMDTVETSPSPAASPASQVPSYGIPEEFRLEISRALRTGRLQIPPDVRELKTQAEQLMGGGGGPISFDLVSPVGKIVEADRPRFSWRPLEGAVSYVVEIYDDKFNPVATSPPTNSTSWTPPGRLRRGQIYVWQVNATRGGEQVRSPDQSASGVRIKILDARRAEEIARLRRQYPNEHLLLAVVMAKAGLIDAARSELKNELARNPRSGETRKLLASLP